MARGSGRARSRGAQSSQPLRPWGRDPRRWRSTGRGRGPRARRRARPGRRARRTGCPSRASAGTSEPPARSATSDRTELTAAAQNQPVRASAVVAPIWTKAVARRRPGRTSSRRRPPTTPRRGQRAEDGDGPADPPAGDQHDSPAGQHHQARAPATGIWPASERRRERRVDPGALLRWPRPTTWCRRPPPARRRASPSSRTGPNGAGLSPAPLSHRRAPAAGPRRSRCGRRCGRPAPSWSTLTSRVSPSQSSRTSLTHWRWPEVSPLTQYSCATGSSTSRGRS